MTEKFESDSVAGMQNFSRRQFLRRSSATTASVILGAGGLVGTSVQAGDPVTSEALPEDWTEFDITNLSSVSVYTTATVDWKDATGNILQTHSDSKTLTPSENWKPNLGPAPSGTTQKTKTVTP